jgi:hypothetical protein
MFRLRAAVVLMSVMALSSAVVATIGAPGAAAQGETPASETAGPPTGGSLGPNVYVFTPSPDPGQAHK